MPFIVKVELMKPREGEPLYEDSVDIYEQRFEGVNLGAIICAANGFDSPPIVKDLSSHPLVAAQNAQPRDITDAILMVRTVISACMNLPATDQRKDATHHLEQGFLALNAIREISGATTTVLG